MLRIELPFPPSELNPNNRDGKHWATVRKAKQTYQRDCWALAVLQMRAECFSGIVGAGDVPLRLTFVQPDKRKRDRDNLLAAMKAGLDGLAAALKVDDSRFEPVTIRRECGAKPGKVKVEIGE